MPFVPCKVCEKPADRIIMRHMSPQKDYYEVVYTCGRIACVDNSPSRPMLLEAILCGICGRNGEISAYCAKCLTMICVNCQERQHCPKSEIIVPKYGCHVEGCENIPILLGFIMQNEDEYNVEIIVPCCEGHIYTVRFIRYMLDDLNLYYISKQVRYIDDLLAILVQTKEYASISGRVMAEYKRVENICADYIRLVQAAMTLVHKYVDTSQNLRNKILIGYYLYNIDNIQRILWSVYIYGLDSINLYQIQNDCQYLRADEKLDSLCYLHNYQRNVEIMLNYLAMIEECLRYNRCHILPKNDTVKLRDILFIESVLKCVTINNVSNISNHQKIYLYCLYIMSLKNSRFLSQSDVRKHCIDQFERIINVDEMIKYISDKLSYKISFVGRSANKVADSQRTFKELLAFKDKDSTNDIKYDNSVISYLRR